MYRSSWKPAVSKYWLFALAGLMWSGVGVMLCRLAYGWLAEFSRIRAGSFGLVGIALAMAAYRFVFAGIVQKNIDRLFEYSEKVCIFAFQAWKSYLVIGLMIGLGITLRLSPLPKDILSIVYITIGGALLLGSFKYYRYLWRTSRSAG